MAALTRPALRFGRASGSSGSAGQIIIDPNVLSLALNPNPVTAGSPADLLGTFTDFGLVQAGQPHQVTMDWGDGQPTTAIAGLSGAPGDAITFGPIPHGGIRTASGRELPPEGILRVLELRGAGSIGHSVDRAPVVHVQVHARGVAGLKTVIADAKFVGATTVLLVPAAKLWSRRSSKRRRSPDSSFRGCCFALHS